VETDFDRYKNLATLDPDTWESGDFEVSDLMMAFRVSSKPVRRLKPGELLFLIRNNLSLEITVPLAYAKIEKDPFLEAAEYPGDLLTALMQASERIWRDNHDWWLVMIGVLEKAVGIINRHMEEAENKDYLPWYLGDDFMAALVHFRDLHRE
jgi:hypothetical protein